MANRTLIIQDPVCGTILDVDKAIEIVYKGKRIFFCSKKCRDIFLKNPNRYAGKIHLHGICPLI